MVEAGALRADGEYETNRRLFLAVHEVAVGYAGVAVPRVMAVLRQRLAGVPGMDDYGLLRIAEEISVGRDPSGL